MTESNLPGRTRWETHEYLRDHGHRVAAAQAYRYLAKRIEADPDYPLRHHLTVNDLRSPA